MIITLDTASLTPIYVQLRNQIVRGIGSGALKTGDRLPTIRQLAEDIGVNMMTVTKAYNVLRNEGFIEIDRRHGATVNPCADDSARYREKVESELELLIMETSLKGMSREVFISLCDEAFNKLAYEAAGV